MKRYTIQQIEENEHQNWLITRKMSDAAISRKLCMQYYYQVIRWPNERALIDEYKRHKKRYRRLLEESRQERINQDVNK
jgi:hypothetical protein